MACAVGSLLSRIRALVWDWSGTGGARESLESLAQRVEVAADGLETAHTRQQRTTRRRRRDLADLRSPEWSVRAEAARALAGASEPEALDALVHALGDPSVEVAVSAAAAVGAIGGPKARDALLAVLQGGDPRYCSATRAAALGALDALLPPEETEPLRSATRDFDADVSVAAIGVVAERGGDFAAGELLGIVEDETGFFMPTTRLAAALGLSRLESLDAALVERAWSREQDPAVYDALARLLARLRGS
jgi:HEAT repeat protein